MSLAPSTTDAAWRPVVPSGHSDYTWGKLGQAPQAKVGSAAAASSSSSSSSTTSTAEGLSKQQQRKQEKAAAAAEKKATSDNKKAAAASSSKPADATSPTEKEKKSKGHPKKDKSAVPPPDVPAPGPPILLGKESSQSGPLLPVTDGRRNILITSALPYVNNVPHLGNIIGCVLSADVYARFCRLRGHNAIYICGTDEYGTATERKALEEGLSPQAICDKYHAIHARIYEWFNIKFDQFGRTSTPKQTEIAQEIFLKLEKNGWSEEKPTKELYCEFHKKFLADRFVEGICPKCAYEDARGDQCDKCGSPLDAIELIKPQCKMCKDEFAKNSSHPMVPPKIVSSNHIFLNLEKLQPDLAKWIDESKVKGEWNENAIQITQGQLNQGLKPRPITKDLKWGVPVPKAGFEQKVFYVWFDAPIGYLSITANYTDQWRQWWNNPKSVELVQFMGKDNAFFHTVMFPSSLMAAAPDYTLLHHISCTEYLNYENMKFSKSRGTGVFGDDAIDSGIPSEVYRYYLLWNRPEQSDTYFLWEDFAQKNNTELLANLGNFINRTLSFLYTKCGNVVPEQGKLTAADEQLVKDVSEFKAAYITQLEHVRIKEGLRTVMAISSRANQYMQDNKPWDQFASDRQRCNTILYVSVQLIATLSVLLEPYMPTLTEKINAQLNQRLFPGALNFANAESSTFQFHIPSGHILGVPSPLFRTISGDEIASLRLRFAGKAATKAGEPFPMQLIVGTIVEATDHPTAPHLYVLQVQTDEPASVAELAKLTRPGFRQIVSQLRPTYEPEKTKDAEGLIGKRVVLLINIKPSNFKGVRSEGFIPTGVKGKSYLLTLEDTLATNEAPWSSASSSSSSSSASSSSASSAAAPSVPNGAVVMPRECVPEYAANFDIKKDLKKLNLITRDKGVLCFGAAPLQVDVSGGVQVNVVADLNAGEGAQVQ